MPQPTCPKCQKGVCTRVKREGWFQTELLPRFGYFPWECSSCRKVSLLKRRGQRKRKPNDPTEIPSEQEVASTPSQASSGPPPSKQSYTSRSRSTNRKGQTSH